MSTTPRKTTGPWLKAEPRCLLEFSTDACKTFATFSHVTGGTDSREI